ncbi:hypothetical protein IW262DRAFT_1278768 [Armillaria fumosa]|nr:hypothetical protein IW262DRAFT_1278768 [Armillaria fumosa]
MVVQPNQKNWYHWVNLTEFAINVSVSQMICFTPFKLNMGYLPSMIKEYTAMPMALPGIKKFANQALANLAEAHDSIIANCVFQMHQANKRRSSELPITKGDLIFLSTKNLNLPKRCA